MNIKKLLLISSVVFIPLFLLSKSNHITPIEKETKKELNEVHDTVLNNHDININTNKMVKKLLKKDNKATTTINGKKVVYIKNAKNVHTTVKNIVNKKIYKTVKNTNISKNYFMDSLKCSSSCGVAIKKWTDAKKYCHIRGSKLPSKSQIEISDKFHRKECSDCSYWTSTEAKRRNGKSYPNKKIYVYNQKEDDFFKFATKYTYVATCLGD